MLVMHVDEVMLDGLVIFNGVDWDKIKL